MNTIEPLKFELDGEGIETDDNDRTRRSRWSETSDFHSIVKQDSYFP